MEQVTQFPNLFDTANPPSRYSQNSQYEFKLQATSTAVVTKAWGLLLHRFTKQQDVVSFYSNDGIVEFDSSTWSQSIKPRNNIQPGSQGTGLRIIDGEKQSSNLPNGTNGHHEDQGSGLAEVKKGHLLLEYDASSDAAILHDPGFIPNGFLAEIAKQLCSLTKLILESEENPTAEIKPREAEDFSSLSVLNQHPEVAKGPQLLHELIKPALVSQDSDSNIAIEHLDSRGVRTKLSYAEFNKKSDRLATKITRVFKLRDTKDSARVIPLLIPQCPSLYIAMLATLKAGCAFCPLNLDTPSERIRFVANDVSASTVLTLSNLSEDFANIEGISLCFADDDISDRNFSENGYHFRKPDPTDLAYVMYTSGSTGQPKGVGLSHMAVTQSLLAHDKYIPDFARFLQFAAPTFDVSQFEIFFTFYRNSALISCDRKRLLNDLPGVLQEMHIDGAELTPTVAGSLLISRQNAPELNVLLTIGEMLTRQVVQEFGGADKNESMLQGMYGPTEAAIHCTLQPYFLADLKVGIVGIPFSTVSALIVKPAENGSNASDVELLPLGQIGELAVGGHQLAVGYLNRPEQTNAAFIDHASHGRIYRTGDKARILPSGLIECLGRISTGQVKLRGQRIELGEIEQVAMKVDECLLATASVLQGNLVLFCQTKERVDAQSAIKDTCEKWLPPFMNPNDIVILKSLPRLPSGKVDKKSLDAQYIEQQQAGSDEESTDQDNEIVQDIITTAKEILGIEFRYKSNLSKSGIESLSAIRLASALRERGYSVNAVDILNADSTETLSAKLQRQEASKNDKSADFESYLTGLHKETSSDPILQAFSQQIESIVPCTPLQISMLAETMSRKTRYCNIIELELIGQTSFKVFKSHLTRIASNNDILRSGFIRQNSSKTPFVRVTWSQLPESQIRLVTKLDYSYSISTEEEYLRPLQVDVLQANANLKVVFKLHHALYDGWSFDLIHKDLQDALQGKSVTDRPSFETVNRFHFAQTGTPLPDSTTSFWKTYLKDFPAIQPLDSNNKTDHVVIMDRTLHISVSDVHRQLGQTFHPQSLFQAALLIAQHQLIQASDHVVGVVTNGRTVPIAGVEEIVGPFIATLPLRVRFESNQTGTWILLKVQELNRTLMEHGSASLSDLKSLSGIEPGTPLFNVLMVWQESLISDSLDTNVIRKVNEINVLETPLFIELEPIQGKVRLRVSYPSQVVDGSVVDSIIKQTETIALALLEKPRTLIQDLPGGNLTNVEKSNPLRIDKADRSHQVNGYVNSESKMNGFGPEVELDEHESDDVKNSVLSALSEATEVSVFDIDQRVKFFSYGLNSISAIFMSKKIQEYSGISVDISEVFAYPTVLSLVKYVRENQKETKQVSKETPTLDSIALQKIKSSFKKSKMSVAKIRPCTPLQEGMLSAEQLSSDNSYFNNTVLHINGDISHILESFQTMTARHEILRTCFASSKDPRFGFAQVVLPNSTVSITQLNPKPQDLSSALSKEMSNINSAIDNMCPPWRVVLFNTGKEIKLLVQMHHALYDGEAIGRLFEELEHTYKSHSLPGVTDYDEFLKESLSLDLDSSDRFWEEMLKGYSPTSFPQSTTLANAQENGHASKTSSLAINLQKLEHLCQDESTTMLAVLQSAWAKVLMTFLGEEDVCFGNVVSGRSIAIDGLDRLVAPCFNTIPVRAKISSTATNRRLLSQLHDANVSALPYQFTPLRRIQKRQTHGGEQLFDTLFILQQSPRKLDSSIWELDRDVGFMGYPLVCEVVPDPELDILNVTIHFSRSFVSVHQVEAIIQAYGSSLESCILQPGSSCLDFDHTPILKSVESLYAQINTSDSIIDTEQIKSAFGQDVKMSDILLTTFQGKTGSEVNRYLIVQSDAEKDSVKKQSETSIIKSTQLSESDIVVIVANEIPRSSIGVPRRRAVQRLTGQASPESQQEDHTAGSKESSSEEAGQVRSVFSTFSGVPDGKIKSQTIFQLGLDSINAIQIANHLRSQGYLVNADDILSNPTVTDLASVLRMKRTNGESLHNSPDTPSIKLDVQGYSELLQSLGVEQEAIKAILPCSPIQAGMVAESLRAEGSVYINHIMLETLSSVDVSKLREAWVNVANRHDILRTGFTSTDHVTTPFVMLCYTKLDAKPHFADIEAGGLQDANSIRSDTSSEIFRSLHSPSWKVTVVSKPQNTEVHFSGHHALFDAESLNIIFNDVRDYYLERKLARPQPLEPALNHIIQAAADKDGAHAQFWKEQLEDVTITRFPNLLPLRNPQRAVGVRTLSLSSSLSNLQRGCRDLNITIQALLQSTWAELLSLYTGEDEVVFGIVLSGREVDATTNVNFPCAVTLPCRLSTSEGKKQILADTMKFGSDVRKHQHFPLTSIQRAAGVDNVALFDTLLVFQRSIIGDDNADDFWDVVDEAATVEYSVSLEVRPLENGEVKLQLVYWDDVLPGEGADILLHQFDVILHQTLTGNEKTSFPQDLLSCLPPKQPILPINGDLLHEVFERSAETHGGATALEFWPDLEEGTSPQKWTYSELQVLGYQYAHFLLENGCPPGSVVATCFEKCPEASFVTLGIVDAGSAFLSIDYSAPTDRKNFIIEDSKAVALITSRTWAEELAGKVSVPVHCIEDIDLSQYQSNRPDVSVNPESTSYCLYTSGSTGTPKGCIISHQNAVQFLAFFHLVFAGRWDSTSRMMQFASYHFDVSVMEQFFSWSIGITLVSTPRDALLEDLAGGLDKLKITHIDLTPSLARLVTPEDVPSLCHGNFITGGEALNQEVLDSWGSKEVIHNGYGPTEATIGCTMYPRVPENGKPSNIGWQYDNAGIYVLRPETDQAVPKGAVGELCVSGVLVSQGYINRPDLNKEKFPTLFGERMYRTGDLVRMLHNESLDFAGRIDDQVKLRGQRLELGEINATIKELDGVKDAATLVVVSGDNQSKQLISFIAPENGSTSEELQVQSDQNQADSVLEACRSRLPVYMVPSRAIMVNKIPLTSNNKVDSKSLKALFAKAHTSGSATAQDQPKGDSSQPPATEAEKEVLSAMEDFFSLPPSSLSPNTSPFQAGIDSISVFSLVRVLRGLGFRKARTQLVLQSETIHNLAKSLSDTSESDTDNVSAAKQSLLAVQQRFGGKIAKALRVNAEAIKHLAPCTPLQQGIIARSFEGSKRQYFNQFVFELSPTVKTAKLNDAWVRVIRNVPILQTFFVPTDDGYVQAYIPSEPNPLTSLFVSEKTIRRDLEKHRQSWISQNQDAFLLPFQVFLLQTKKTNRMVMHVFHSLYDAMSLELLLNNLASEYGESTPRYGPSFFEALPYGPLCKQKDATSFWKDHLSEAVFNPIVPKTENTGFKTCSADLKDLEWDGLQELCQNLNVTHQAVVQTCWMAVLQEKLGAPTTIGTIVSGRSIDVAEAEKVIGPLFNTIPLWLGFEEGETWKDVIRRSHQHNISSLPFHHTSLRDISKALKKSPLEPLFDTLFVLQRHQSTQNSGQQLWNEIDSPAQADYPLSFEMAESRDGSYVLTLVAQSVAASENECLDLLNRFDEVMTTVVAESSTRVDNVMKIKFMEHVNGIERQSSSAPLKKTISQGNTKNSKIVEILAKEISALAGVDSESISTDTSIFELGLDSIDAIKLSSRLKRRGFQLTVSKIIQNHIVADMAEHGIAHALPPDQDGRSTRLSELKAALTKDLKAQGLFAEVYENVLPATPLQEAMIAEMEATGFQNYLNHDVLELSPDIDLRKLLTAWEDTIRQNPILRTAFVKVQDTSLDFSYCQLVHHAEPQSVLGHELGPGEDFDVYFERTRQHFANDEQNQVPFRLAVINKGSGKYLALTMAHALYDGWSQNLLHQDIARSYAYKTVSRPSYESMLSTIMDSSSNESKNFWKDTITGSPGCEFPTREKETTASYFKERSSTCVLESIQSFCKSTNITLQALGQFCWSAVLASYVGSLDVTFGVVLSGRDDEQAQELLFPTMNTVAIRILLHDSRKDMLQYVQSNLADVMQHQHFPLRKVQQIAAKKLFNTLFIYQKKPQAEIETEPLYKSVMEASDLGYPVCVEMEILDNQLIWRTMCKDTALAEAEAGGIIDRLDSVLETIMDSPDKAAIQFSKSGTSVCELPPFQEQDKHETKSSSQTQVEDGKSTVAESEVEKTVVAALATVSKVPEADIRLDQTIFHLGLDSVSAIKVSAILRKSQFRIPVSAIMRAENIRAIAAMVKTADQPSQNGSHINGVDSTQLLAEDLKSINTTKILAANQIPTEQVQEIFPATAVQTLFVSMWQTSSGSIFYPSFKFTLEGQVSDEQFQIAWNKLTEEQPILRTVLLATGSRKEPLIQVILREAPKSSISFCGAVKSQQHELSALLVELNIQRLEKTTSLTFHIHHALYDAVSQAQFLDRFQQLLNDPSTTPQPSTASFADFIALTRSKEAKREQEVFWTSYFRSLKQLRLALDKDISLIHRTAYYTPSALPSVSKVEKSLQKAGLSVQSLFFASVAKTLVSQAPPSKPKDGEVVLGVYLSNRALSLPGIETLNAPTLNIVPLRLTSVGSTSLTDLAKQAQDGINKISSEPQALTSLWQITDWTGVVVDVFVNFLRLPEGESDSSFGSPSDNIRITEIPEGHTRTPEVPDDMQHFTEPEALKNHPVKDLYPPTVDIEAAVRERDGNRVLDIGVFGPRAIVEQKAAEKWLEGIRGEFEGFSS